MTSFRRFLTLASAAVLATAVFLGARPAAATNYAVCTGVNEYNQSYIKNNNLEGCVPDATNVMNLITSRGEWQAANVKLLTNSGAKLTTIRQAISNVAAQAVSGDKFLYFHSSHGGNYNTYYTTTNGDKYLHYSLNSTGDGHVICSYNADYEAQMMATDLASFRSGVEIVVMMDTCHSAGMFKYAAATSSKNARTVDEAVEGSDADDLAAGFFMQAVMAQLEQLEEEQIQRGLRPRSAKSLASNIGWIAAADYDQYSWDGTYGGAFTEAFINGVTNRNKMCDNSTYGNQDGYASFYEGWNYAKDIARGQRSYAAWQWDEDYEEYSYCWTDPQCANTNVLKSVLVGWAGTTAPNVAPQFSSSTASTSGYKGDTISFDFSSLLTAGSPAPTYTISTSASGYTFTGSTLSFTPAATGTYTFTCTAANTAGSATCTLTVTVTPAPPETPSEVSVVSSDSFTATWSPVSGASSYELVVLEGAASGSGTIVTETFANASFSTTSSSYANQTISGCDLGTWTATQCRGDYETPVVKATGTLTSPAITGGVASVEFDYVWPFSSDSSGTCDIDLYVDGTYKDSATVTAGTAGTASFTSFDSVAGTPSIMFTNKATSNKRIRVTEVRIGTAGSRAKALPRAVGDVVYSNTVGNVTSFEVTGLQPDTTYSYSVRAIVNGEPTGWSDSVSVTTTEGNAAPVWSDIPVQTVTVGATCTLDLADYLTGSPTPTISMAETVAGASLTGTVFTFTPTVANNYTFTFTASNSEGDDEAILAVTVSAAPVTVPTLLAEATSATTAYATWSECTGVTSYTLQLASDNQFTTGGGSGGGESVELVNEGFANGKTLSTGWTVESGSIGGTYESNSTGNYGVSAPSLKLSSTVTLSTPALSNPTNVSFWYKGNPSSGSSITSTLVVEQLVGDAWDEVGSAEITSTAATFSHALNSSATQVRFVFTKNSGNVAFDDVIITGTSGSGSSGSGSLIAEYNNIADTEYEFTGLTPNTTYYARVKGNDGWSNVAEFTTEQGADSAPVWSTIPAISVTVGEFIPNFYPATYVSGTPTPSITLSQTTASSGEYEFEDGLLVFQPMTIGSFDFTFLADNGIGSPASATLTVNSTGTAPAISVPQSTYSTSLGGADVEFTVTATGTPKPTLELFDTTASSGVEFDENDGYFSFTPYATGDFTFTFTASNLLGSDSKIVTVNVSEAAVTVPELTVGDVTANTAYATWSECTGVTEYTLQLSTNEFSAGGATITDTLTAAKFGLAGNSYGAGSYASEDSGAGYAAWAMKNGNAIQLKSKDNVSGIVVTNSAGSVSEVRVSFASGTLADRTLNIYGSASAYPAPSALYTNSTAGELLGTIVYDGSTAAGSYTINGSYAFIGIRSASGAIYLDSVEIDWTPANGGTTSKGLAKDGGDGIQTFNVADTEYTFTGLTPETKYYARVKGEDDWSNVEEFTTLAGADSAPVWSALPTGETAYVEDVYELPNIASYVSGSPAPEITVTGPAGVLAEIKDGNFNFIPDALGDFVFTFTADNGVGEAATATLTVTGIADAPAFVDLQSTVSGYAGEEVSFTVVATGKPAPVLAVDAADGVYYDFDSTTGVFEFVSDNTGDFEFEFTAANIAATVTQTVTVTISPAPAIPTLLVGNETDTTAYATWDECAGVTTYTLQIASDNKFTTSGEAGAVLEADFSDTTGWTFSGTGTYGNSPLYGASSPAISFKNTGNSAISPEFSGGTKLSFWAYGNLGSGSTFSISGLVDGDWTEIETVSIDQDGKTYEVNLPAGTTQLRFDFTKNDYNCALDDVVVTGTIGVGSLIAEYPVNDTEYTFTALTPGTTYYARVKGEGNWSEVVEFTTEVYVAPEFSEHAVSDTGTAGVEYMYDFSDLLVPGAYPAPTYEITPANLLSGESGGAMSFTPAVAGEYEFTCVATNAAGYDTCVLTVTVSGGETPLSDFEQWLQTHGVAIDTSASAAAPNGHTYWDNYIADVAPDGDFLELAISETAGYLDIENASQNRYYQFIYYTNLLAEPVIQDLGPGFDEMRVEYPVEGTFFARIRALLAAPSQP